MSVETEVDLLNPEGELIGAVMMPTGLEVLKIGSDYVLGMWHDEFGVAHVPSSDVEYRALRFRKYQQLEHRHGQCYLATLRPEEER
jgi:hypothetical protein